MINIVLSILRRARRILATLIRLIRQRLTSHTISSFDLMTGELIPIESTMNWQRRKRPGLKSAATNNSQTR